MPFQVSLNVNLVSRGHYDEYFTSWIYGSKYTAYNISKILREQLVKYSISHQVSLISTNIQ